MDANDQNALGDFLTKCAESGLNVVITMRANTTNWNYPKGNFQSPLVPGQEQAKSYDYEVVMKTHPLFAQSVEVKQSGSNNLTSRATLNSVGQIQLVAEWKDEIPMAAVRYDQTGMVTSLGFCPMTMESLGVVLNALCLSR